jgi:ribA/ribD-fused uncharacterized protein
MQLNSNPNVVIDWFDEFMGENDYWFLSNFAEGFPLAYKGSWFRTSEHAYAWSKVDPQDDEVDEWKDLISQADDPGQAKMLGRRCPIRADWEQVKFNVMREIVHAKFTQNLDAQRLLLATGDAYLQEGTFWGDDIWGVIYEEDVPFYKRVGTNWLGTILMEVRTMIRSIASADKIHEPDCRAYHKGQGLVMVENPQECEMCVRIRDKRYV